MDQVKGDQGAGIQQPGKMKRKKEKKKRRGGGLINLLLIIGIIVVIALFIRAESERRSAKQELERKAQEIQELQAASQRSGQEVADQVLENLRRHIELPTDPAPTVATIVDIESLREANEFYQSAENGDHLIITATRAILYDSSEDRILDVVPVQINPDDAGQPAEGVEGENLDEDGNPIEPEEGEEGEEGTDGDASPDPSASPDAEGEIGDVSPGATPEI